jgi:hypothetical protein
MKVHINAGFAAALLVVGISQVLFSCGRREPAGDRFEIQKLYGQETAVQLRIQVSNGKIRTSDQLLLVVETRAAEDWSVSFPEDQARFGEFEVAERLPEKTRMAGDGRLITSRAYVLKPFLPGVYEIPPLEVSFDERGGAQRFSVISDEIPVQVVSVLPPQLGAQDMEDVAGPVIMQRGEGVWFTLAGAILAAGAGAIALLRKKRPLPAGSDAETEPWKAALENIDALLSRRLVETGRYQDFYTGISDVARWYIEHRFKVRAPEQTTEEFLNRVHDHGILAGYTGLLENFLVHCDMVKFARHRPNPGEVAHAVISCRQFIIGTSPPSAAVRTIRPGALRGASPWKPGSVPVLREVNTGGGDEHGRGSRHSSAEILPFKPHSPDGGET